MENPNPTLMLILNSLSVFLFLALLYIIGGIGDNIKRIRRLLEAEASKRHESDVQSRS